MKEDGDDAQGGGTMDDKMKPLDRGQFVQFLTDFPSDKADYEKLQECLEYMKH